MIKHVAFTMDPVEDLARARRFYEEDLGLTMAKSCQDAWFEYDLPGGCFEITTLADGVIPSANAGGSIAFEVEDVDEMVEKLRMTGTPIKVKPFSTSVCRTAVVIDPEGNAVTLHKVTQIL